MDVSKFSRAVDANELSQALVLAEWAQLPRPQGFGNMKVDDSIDTSDATLKANRLEANSISNCDVLTVLECFVFHFIEAKAQLKAALDGAEAEGLRCVDGFFKKRNVKPRNYQVKSYKAMKRASPDEQRDELIKFMKASREMRHWTQFLEQELRDSEIVVEAADYVKPWEWVSRIDTDSLRGLFSLPGLVTSFERQMILAPSLDSVDHFPVPSKSSDA